jgi:hypothetical protein
MGRGDQIQFASTSGISLSSYTNVTQFGSVSTTSLGATSNNPTPVLVQGTYQATGVFSVTTAGADLLLQWDTDGAGSGTSYESVVLIGANTGFGGAAASTSNITGIVASTAGVFTFV